MDMARLAALCAFPLAAGAWACSAPFGRHEGVAVRLCATPWTHCTAPPHVTLNKFDYEQMQWQHCNGSVFTAAYDEDYGEALQGDVGSTVYSSVSGLVKKAKQVSAGENFALVLQQRGKISAFGRNEYGKLGVGADIDKVVYEGARVNLPGRSKGRAVSAGEDHSLFVADDGTAYAAGRNDHGQLCQPKAVSESNTPVRVHLPPGAFVVDVSAGDEHSLFLTRDGRVFACGNNVGGRLGLGNVPAGPERTPCEGRRRRARPGPSTPAPPVEEDIHTPHLVKVSDTVAIAAGKEHSLFLQRCGKALAVGSNEEGELGLGSGVNATGTPTEVDLSGVVAISAGGPNSLFLLQDGSVYGAGENDYFQVAVGNDDNVCELTRARIDDVVAIQTGEYGTMFMTADGGTHFSGTYELTDVLFGGLDDDYYAPVPWRVQGFDWYDKPSRWLRSSFQKFLAKKYGNEPAQPLLGKAGAALPLIAACVVPVLSLLGVVAVRFRRSKQALLAVEQEQPLTTVAADE